MAKFVKLVEEHVTCYSTYAESNRVKKGFVYEVEKEKMKMLQEVYKLKGIEGYFHAFNFKEIPVFEAKAGKEPFVCDCLQGFLRRNKETESWKLCNTSSIIQNVRKMNSKNLYEVITQNTVYNLEVI